jgi:glycosyltransferase involved in cell wall biosynthesis
VNILIWSQHFWPEGFVINDIARALVQQGEKVTVFTGKPNYPEGDFFSGYGFWGIKREFLDDIEIIRIPIIPRKNGTSLQLIMNYMSFIFMGYFFSPFLFINKKVDFIVVYATSPLIQTLPAIFLSWIKKIPLVLWVQDLWPESIIETGHIKNRFLIYLIKKVVTFCYNHSDLLLVQSVGFKSSIETLVSPGKIIKYLPNSAPDLQCYLGSYSENALFVSQKLSQCFSLVFAGNLGKAQSIETILAAAEKLKWYENIKFFLIGSGSMRSEISKIIYEEKLSNVELIDRLPPSDMAMIFKASSVLIISLKKGECFAKTVPSKLQAYFSAGKPIVGAMDGEGRAMILEAKAGLCVTSENSTDLAKSIEQLYHMDNEERKILGINGRIFYEKYFIHEKVGDLLLIMLKKLLV